MSQVSKQRIVLQTLPGVAIDLPNLSRPTFSGADGVRFYNKAGFPEKIKGFLSIGPAFAKSPSAVLSLPREANQVALVSTTTTRIPNKPNSISFKQLEFTANGDVIFPYNATTPAKSYLNYYLKKENSYVSIDFDEVIPTIQIVNASNKGDTTTPSYYLISFTDRKGLASSKSYPLYYGEIHYGEERSLSRVYELNEIKPKEEDSTQLSELTTSGGSLVLNGELILLFGEGGVIRWNQVSVNPEEGAESKDVFINWPKKNYQMISDTKLVAARAVRSSGLYSALLWSLNSLYLITATVLQETTSEAERETFTAFSRTTLATDISIISEKSIVEFDGQYFWIGDNQFYVYAGNCSVLENSFNRQEFFNDLDYRHRNNIVGFVNHNNREIWWAYPSLNGNGQNNKILIYNTLLNSFHIISSPAPISTFIAPSNFFHPIFVFKGEKREHKKLYMAETGLNFTERAFKGRDDQRSILQEFPLPASVSSQYVDLDPSSDHLFELLSFEPNFILQHPENGQFTLFVFSYLYAQNDGFYSKEETGYSFPLTSQTNYIPMLIPGRYFVFLISSSGKDLYFKGWEPRISYRVLPISRNALPEGSR